MAFCKEFPGVVRNLVTLVQHLSKTRSLGPADPSKLRCAIDEDFLKSLEGWALAEMGKDG